MKAALAALALGLAGPVLAQEPAAWRALDAETGGIRDLAGLEQLALDFPDSSSVRLRLLGAQIEAGDGEGVLATLRWLKERGYVFEDAARDRILTLAGEGLAEEVRALLLPPAEPIEASVPFATVPAEAGLVESVFVAEGGSVLLATSITGRSLHLRIGRQPWVSASIPQANDLSGIVSEPDAAMGWVASANLDGSQDTEPRFSGLIGLTGDNDNPVLVPAPAGAAVSDLAIGADATVYASDPLGGGIYRKPIGATALDTLVAPGTFRSPQGLAVSADGKRLYVSDYRYGLATIDFATGNVERLESDVPAILDGVDGLWLHQGELVAVQNGTAPMRISAFTLSEDGMRITAVRTLEQAHPGWTEPLGGSVAGGALYYVATGQWDRFDKGEPVDGSPARPTEIRRLPLAP